MSHACRARNVRKHFSASDLNGSGLVDGSEDAEARAEQGALVGLRGMKASPGRPNISAVLARVVQEYSTEQEIGVVAAGALEQPPHAQMYSCGLSQTCRHSMQCATVPFQAVRSQKDVPALGAAL